MGNADRKCVFGAVRHRVGGSARGGGALRVRAPSIDHFGVTASFRDRSRHPPRGVWHHDPRYASHGQVKETAMANQSIKRLVEPRDIAVLAVFLPPTP